MFSPIKITLFLRFTSWFIFGQPNITGNSDALMKFSQDFTTIIEYETCKFLIDSVHHSWQTLEKERIHKSVFKPVKTASKEIYYPCMTTLRQYRYSWLTNSYNFN